jgi:hypothetical protein
MFGQPNPTEDKQEKPPRRYWYATYRFVDIRLSHIIEFLLALALFAAAVTQIFVYLKQARTMRDTLDEMKKTFAAERAYIFPTGVARDHSKPLIPGYEVQASFKNFGKTPAFVHGIALSCRFFDKPPPAIFPPDGFSVQFDEIADAGASVGDYKTTVMATENEILRAKIGDGSIRCLWNIDYTDVRDFPHTGGLCLVYNFGFSAFIECQENQYHHYHK